MKTTQLVRALISCTDKTGIVDFAKFLAGRGVELLSTGGTAKLLRDSGVAVKEVAEFTGFPEILDGRVKTLHPKVHGGLLHIRDNVSHQKQIKDNGIEPIDLVIVNLYAFEQTVAKPNCSFEDAIENIDIGGPSMLRSAAKNHHDVIVVVDPADYAVIQEELTMSGAVSSDTRKKLALKVFQTTAAYDAAISRYLSRKLAAEDGEPSAIFPETVTLTLAKQQELRYGENPHQKAAFYRDQSTNSYGVAQASQLQGKELSFNNILDLDSAYRCCQEFALPACVIVKHTNPCGVAVAETLVDSFIKARSADPVSAFGGIIAMNRVIDAGAAKVIAETFFEAIVAPGYSEEAKQIFATKKNLRLMVLENQKQNFSGGWDIRRIGGGFLIQDADTALADLMACDVVTSRKPTIVEYQDLAFAWAVVKHVKSNAITFAKAGQTLGTGAGQMSRVDAVKIAIAKAQEIAQNEHILKGSVLASDAFFPFRDGLDVAAKSGVLAVVQPGGSVRDDEVIAAANEHGIAMVFARERHFKH